MSFMVQRLGFDGTKQKWFNVEARETKRDAIRYAALRQFGNSAEHRVVDSDGAVVWPEEEA